MKIKKSRALFLAVLSLSCLFGLAGCDSCGGCVSPDADGYSLLKVLEYVDSVCEEPYRVVGRELVEELPYDMEYYFEVTTRDLSFTANSYIGKSAWFGYFRTVSCDYKYVVKSQYYDELEQVLQADDHYLGWEIYLLSFSDIDSVVDTISAADQVYRPELAYNSEEFLADNPLDSVWLKWYPSEEEALAGENGVYIKYVYITGQNDIDELYDELANRYAQLCVDGEIENMDDVPEEYLETR